VIDLAQQQVALGQRRWRSATTASRSLLGLRQGHLRLVPVVDVLDHRDSQETVPDLPGDRTTVAEDPAHTGVPSRRRYRFSRA
jgi:hypothetical protein